MFSLNKDMLKGSRFKILVFTESANKHCQNKRFSKKKNHITEVSNMV